MKTSAMHFASLIFAFALGTMTAVAAPKPFALLHSLFDPGTNTQASVEAGYSVAAGGNIVAVGAPEADVGAINAGVVNVYDATTGGLLHTLRNPRAFAEEHFGSSVAISGTRVVVGVPSAIPQPLHEPPFPSALARGGVAYVYDLAGANPTVPTVILTNLGPALDDRYGAAVAISGTRVVVGAPRDDTGAPSSGRAYVFDLTSGHPSVPVATLVNPVPSGDAGFGFAVAISGARVAVGAYGADAGAMDAGSVYVYDVAGGSPTVPALTLLNPSPGEFDQFGVAVGISGTRVVIGARYDDTAGYETGIAYVYELSGATPTAPAATLTDPSPSSHDNFGFAVGIEGTRVVVGALGDNSGAAAAGSAYVYDLTGATPEVPVATLSNPNPAEADYFGFSVAIAGTRVVAGALNDDAWGRDAGNAYVYDLASSTPTVPVSTLATPNLAGFERFGSSVSISGTRLVIGAQMDDTGATDAGSAYVYDLVDANPGVPVGVLRNPSPGASDYFGSAVAISGPRVVVGAFLDDTGATDAGSAYVYDLTGATPTVPVVTLNNPSPEHSDDFGFSVSISGARVVVGAPYDNTGAQHAGSAYVYDLAGATPHLPVFTVTNPNPASSYFGRSVAISGTRVVIGAPDAGVAYVYDLAGATPAVPILTLTNPSPAPEDHFGNAVAISGTRIAVGAEGDDAGAPDAGSAYVYDLNGATPTVPVATLSNPNPAASDFFGGSVAISGTRVVVGANKNDTGAPDAGSAYLYDLADANPAVPVAVLTNPSPGNGDNFGQAVAIDGAMVVAGAPADDTNAADRGAAYVFGLPSLLGIPALRIAPSAPGLATISWTSAASSGFVLQYADGVAPAHWVTAPSGALSPVTVSATNGSRFYRLIRP